MAAIFSGYCWLVAAMMGPGYGQPTLTASLCDFVVAVRGQAEFGMAPAAVVRAATGEEVDASAVYSADAQASASPPSNVEANVPSPRRFPSGPARARVTN